jgi:Xaa-Pro aminopeptidase
MAIDPIDVGAEYANYSSDMTRTIQSGKYSDRQKPFTMLF